MLSFNGRGKVQVSDALNRRDFLRIGGLTAGAAGLILKGLEPLQAASPAKAKSCILLFLVGGPSQLETWDLKPDAPTSVRGPFKPIPTNVPGIHICEDLPRMAQLADRYAIIRSVFHRASAVHETGQQLLQTGRLARGSVEHPHIGAAVSYLRGPVSDGVPAHVMLPGPIGNTGVNVSHGQGASHLGQTHEAHRLRDADYTLATLDESDSAQARYGRTTFGRSCLLARRMVEEGVRFVTVNMFDTVFNEITWDCHADGGSLAATLDDYRTTLCPMFDHAYSALVRDLDDRGLLDTTLVVAMGEFGRTPRLNPRGGRDHWPGVWSVVLAGGGIRGGQIIGSTDALAAEPKDRPVHASQIPATICHALGIDPNTQLPGPHGNTIPLVESDPVWELFS
jgi:uncharacterized protein (DUF1501 family)